MKYSPLRNSAVFSEMCTIPGRPVLSILLASVTSLLHTSNLNLRLPTIPQRTVPVWMPTRMFTDSLRSSSKSLMAEIMLRPISTQFRAWFGFGSGHPGREILRYRGDSHKDLSIKSVPETQ